MVSFLFIHDGDDDDDTRSIVVRIIDDLTGKFIR